jgi:hypothetical protein
MAKFVNTGEGEFARVIHVGGVMLVPGVETELPDDIAEKVKGFQPLLDSGVVKAAGQKAEPAKAPAKKD